MDFADGNMHWNESKSLRKLSPCACQASGFCSTGNTSRIFFSASYSVVASLCWCCTRSAATHFILFQTPIIDHFTLKSSIRRMRDNFDWMQNKVRDVGVTLRSHRENKLSLVLLDWWCTNSCKTVSSLKDQAGLYFMFFSLSINPINLQNRQWIDPANKYCLCS